ncbi:pentapeptide repeat-containing protein [Paenibacillus sp. CF384]|uniref:pentapeptide repeat-containing protein n=1 Tax=Paenibacillus sp. CF384 TaxID=1884382 RepID=UPI000AB83533
MSNLPNSLNDVSSDNLRANCDECFGLCCIALSFSASEGFPTDKKAGEPCINLKSNYRCGIHESLGKRGLKGCIAFECFGAGQKVSQISFDGQDWRKSPDSANRMFKVFIIMMKLHELLWYLTETLTLPPAQSILGELRSKLEETERLTYLKPDSLLELDVGAHQASVNTLLLKVSELVRYEARNKQKVRSGQKTRKTIGRGADLIGTDLRKMDLRGANLRGAYLIAADLSGVDLGGTDFIGADFRDANLRGADLSKSIFLTQAQLNAAKGDSRTKVPPLLKQPAHWHSTNGIH